MLVVEEPFFRTLFSTVFFLSFSLHLRGLLTSLFPARLVTGLWFELYLATPNSQSLLCLDE